jgi:flagellar assembly factor FliW
MLKVLSSNFGPIEHEPGELFTFPDGLPGFPDETVFVPVQIPQQFPLVYLQSTRTPSLCFLAPPVQCVVAGYELSVNADDLAKIGLNHESQLGRDMLCLALVAFGSQGQIEANLRAPLLINVADRRAVQAIQNDDRYPIRYAIEGKEAAPC